MNKPLISIIVPIYNCEKYIEECILSLINQTFEDIEIIVIDDGSTDSSKKIIEYYKEKDSRIRYYYQTNKGVSFARNNGVLKASGKYIMFVASDDFIEKDCCLTLINKMKNNIFDCIIYNCSLFYNNHNYIKKSLGDDSIIYDCEELEHNYLFRRCFGLKNNELNKIEELDYLSSCCLKLYKLDIILKNKIEFFDINIIGTYEDGLFNLDYFKCCKKILYIPNALYHYRRDNEKSNTSNYNPQLVVKWSKLFAHMQNLIHELDLTLEFQECLDNRIILSVIGLGLNCVQDNALSIKEKNKKVKEIINSEIYKKRITNINIKNMKFKWRVFFAFVKIRFSFLVTMMLVLMNYLRRKK